MKVRVRQIHGAIDVSIECKVEFCNREGVWFNRSVDGKELNSLRELYFTLRESKCNPGLYCCPWESSDSGDCFLVVEE